jgi:hypothetical protein
MKRKRFTVEQVIRMLREAAVHLSQERVEKFTLPQASPFAFCAKLGSN